MMRRARTVAAWVLLVGALIGWPLSAFTWAKDEPPFVLGLSWLAIIIGAAELLTGSQIHEEQNRDRT
jgi:ribose/xylose/arabinose/galactoside ABC-type transport system permease subunit